MKKIATALAILIICLFSTTTQTQAKSIYDEVSIFNFFSDATLINGSNLRCAEFAITSKSKEELKLVSVTVVTESGNKVTVEDIRIRNMNAGPTSLLSDFHDMNFIIPAKKYGMIFSFAVYANIRMYGAPSAVLITLKNFLFQDKSGKYYLFPDEVTSCLAN